MDDLDQLLKDLNVQVPVTVQQPQTTAQHNNTKDTLMDDLDQLLKDLNTQTPALVIAQVSTPPPPPMTSGPPPPPPPSGMRTVKVPSFQSGYVSEKLRFVSAHFHCS